MTRRSVPKTHGPAPDRRTILELLEAGVRAPNHHLTEPWRFIVLGAEALKELGEVWAADAERHGKDPDKVRDKPLRAPVVIAVIERPKGHLPKVFDVEEYHAVGALMQNILLAAHAKGLGAMLRTGPPVHIPEVGAMLGLGEGERIAGLIYLGRKPPGDDQRPMSRRTPAVELTEWRGFPASG